MRRRIFLTMILALALAASMTGCSGKSTQTPETTAAGTEATGAEETTAGETVGAGNEETTAPETEAAETAEEAVYESADGWSVRYTPADFEVQEEKDGATLKYTGESGGESVIKIHKLTDQQPEEVLGILTGTWELQDSIERFEGYFPGTEDKWGFWRTMTSAEDNAAPFRTAVAAEYNGGVLVCEAVEYKTGDEEKDTVASDIFAAVIDSISYQNYEPQTMYEYVPGTYTTVYEDEVDGTGTIVLNADHTGQLQFQDDIDITWGSYELTAADNSFAYEYTIEGTTLMVNVDDMWLSFEKEDGNAAGIDEEDPSGAEIPMEDATPDCLEKQVWNYFMGEIGSHFDDGEAEIGLLQVVGLDDSNPEDILVWGDFWYLVCDVEGDTLVAGAGGDFPGLIHMKQTEDGSWEGIGFDRVEDGSNYEASAKEIFGDKFDAFQKIYSDDAARNKAHLQIMANWAEANGMEVTKYQDYGTDPVELPQADGQGYYVIYTK